MTPYDNFNSMMRNYRYHKMSPVGFQSARLARQPTTLTTRPSAPKPIISCYFILSYLLQLQALAKRLADLLMTGEMGGVGVEREAVGDKAE